MSLNPNRSTFTFNHTGQPDEYGLSVGDYTVVQSNLDSRAQENLDDINNIKTAIQSVVVGDEGAKLIGTNAVLGQTNVEGALSALNTSDTGNVKLTGNQIIDGIKTFLQNVIVPLVPTANNHATSKKYVDDSITSVAVGVLPTGSVTDNYLSDTPGQIKDRVNTNTVDITNTNARIFMLGGM